MGEYLLKPGSRVNVIVSNEIKELLIIGKCEKDSDSIMHDYVGVSTDTGYKGKVYFFEHREIIKVNEDRRMI